MKKFFVGPIASWSAGCMAIAVSTVEGIKNVYPDASFIMLATHAGTIRKQYRVFCERCNVKVIGPSSSFSTSSKLLQTVYSLYFSIYALCALSYYSLRRGYDLNVETGMDAYSDFYGTIHQIFSATYSLLPSIIFRRPFMIYAVSLGPFNNKLVKNLMKFILGKANLITLRDQISMDYLGTIGVRSPNMHLTADPAFLLKPEYSKRIDDILTNKNIIMDDLPLVGVTANIQSYLYMNSKNPKEEYVNFMARMIDHIIENLNAKVILLLHDASDRDIQEDVYKSVRNKNRVYLINANYTTSELKAIIGKCQMFVGSRMHSLVASTSMQVPSIALSYNRAYCWKFYGVLDKILSQRFIVDIASADFKILDTEIYSIIQYVWKNRGQIAEQLKEEMIKIRRRALLNNELIEELFEPPFAQPEKSSEVEGAKKKRRSIA